MMIEIFTFERQQVRFVGTPDKLEWIAIDLCKILDIKNVSDTVAEFEDNEKGIATIYTPGGEQSLLTLTEPGLYRLIFKSRKGVAKRFQYWLFHEVLPAIRKTGSYSINNQNSDTDHNSNSRLAEDLMLADYAARSAQNAGVDKNITEQIKLEGLMKMYPHSEHLLKPQKEAIAASNPIPERPMTATEVGQQLSTRLGCQKISARKVNNRLLQLGYQTSVTRIKRSTGKEVHDYYQPTEKGEPHSTLLLSLYVDGKGKATKAQLRWFESIISILAHNWEIGDE